MAGSERFLVTGALGCIGAWTVRRLVHEGVPVVAFDADADVRRLRLLMDEAQLSRVDIVRGDITNLSLLEETLDAHRITHVIHLAALLHPRFRSDPPLGARVNVLGGVNLFEAVARRAQRIPRIVYASSIAVYDKSDAADDVAIMHHSPAHPTTLYGVFKQAEEAMARVYFQDRGVSSIGLRPATVFGAGRDYGLTAAPTQAVLAAALGRPFHIPYSGRSHVHYADDLARIFIACARSGYRGAEVFNMRGVVADMRDVVETIESVVPRARGSITCAGPSLELPDDYDAAALEQVIGPLPRTPLREAVTETLALFRSKIASGEIRET
ncbi:NAD(P)-dependent oxidoreductase [Cupriavidus sp. UYPR2.512]|uniref:NAD-dependent epimerase/dehydratase family protein n=1 Tax=Cupriavidus sp. UYPR2.512 TaxID=1080187 RepID=UPI0003A3E895|nr:NAD-dependent epimerase/dehydratase family protein [Cupriavidus sp. UYPR2.512]UIF91516.1 NAD-dependent epimerase/dehydratase family protein [Cupriavidus necator]